MDHYILLGIYQQRAGIFEDVMWSAHRSAYPVFIGAAPAAWGGSLLAGDGYAAAYRLTVSEVIAGTATHLIKKYFARNRPFIILSNVKSRSGYMTRKAVLSKKRYSFPSGHATSAFSIATSLSLSFPRWYVIAPSMAWAVAVAMSRPWLGVHYPSDVMAGALIGATVATGIYLLRHLITPAFLKSDDGSGGAPKPNAPPMMRLHIPLG